MFTFCTQIVQEWCYYYGTVIFTIYFGDRIAAYCTLYIVHSIKNVHYYSLKKWNKVAIASQFNGFLLTKIVFSNLFLQVVPFSLWRPLFWHIVIALPPETINILGHQRTTFISSTWNQEWGCCLRILYSVYSVAKLWIGQADKSHCHF